MNSVLNCARRWFAAAAAFLLLFSSSGYVLAAACTPGQLPYAGPYILTGSSPSEVCGVPAGFTAGGGGWSGSGAGIYTAPDGSTYGDANTCWWSGHPDPRYNGLYGRWSKVCDVPAGPTEGQLAIKALLASSNALQYSGAPSITTCYQGTVIKGSGAICGGPPVAGQDNCTVFGPFTDTAVSCVGAGVVGANGLPAPNTEPPLGTPSNCAKGLVPGEVNGVGVCLRPTTGNTVKLETTSQSGTSVNADGSPGPASPSGSKTVETKATCTTDSCTTNSTTTTKDATGAAVTQQETKTQSKDDYCATNKSAAVCQDALAVDSPMPAAPKLYKPSYPNGIAGVWADRKAQLTSAPLTNLMSGLMPSVASGGSCPTMYINLNLTSWAMYGVKDVAPPCYLWDWGKAIIILSALLLARALIFGG